MIKFISILYKGFSVFGILFFLIIHPVTGQGLLSKEERMEWWRHARFGMFIHFGVYAQWAGVYNGHQQAKGGAEWIMNRCKIPVAEYKERAKEFNPINFDADAWVKMARDAGMKYVIITAKHHDGFALFDSRASDWNIADATAYRKDLLRPLAVACRKYGMKLGFYYSQAQDWGNAGGSVARKEMKEGWPDPDSAKIDAYTLAHKGHWDPVQETRSFDDYIDEIAVPQVKELLTNYGDIAVLWWDTPTDMTVEAAKKFQQVLKLQPAIITNDRLKRPDFPGDTKTPEQKIPDKEELDGKDWETCMTMNGSWGYKSWDNNWKSTQELVKNLMSTASKGGNYLLNIGPKADGSFPEESMDRLRQIGNWMRINSEAVYGTRANPLEEVPWGCITAKESKRGTMLYLTVFDRPANGQLVVPDPDRKIRSARMLANEKKLKFNRSDGSLRIFVPAQLSDEIATVIKLELKGRIETSGFRGRGMRTGELD